MAARRELHQDLAREHLLASYLLPEQQPKMLRGQEALGDLSLLW